MHDVELAVLCHKFETLKCLVFETKNRICADQLKKSKNVFETAELKILIHSSAF